MKMFKKILVQANLVKLLVLCIGILWPCKSALAQQVLDSLQVAYLKTQPNSNQRFEVAGKYMTALFFNNNPAKAQEIFQENLPAAIKFSDGAHAARLYAIQAMNQRLNQDYIGSRQNIANAQNYAQTTQDLEAKGYVNYANGWLLIRNNQEAEGVRSLLKALEYYNQSKPSATLNIRKSTVYNELTGVYANWGEFDLQQKYGQRALDLALIENNPETIFNAYMLMGNIYEQRYDKDPDNTQILNQARDYYLKAIDTYQNNKSVIPFGSHLSFAANNLASLYLSYYPESFHPQVLYYANIAKEQGLKTQQYTHVASAYGIMAEVALLNKQTALTKEYLLSSFNQMSKSSIPDLNITLSILQGLSDVSEMQGDYKEALKYQKEYLQKFKALFNQEQVELSKKLEAQFDKQRQEQQLVNMTLLMEKKQRELELVQALGVQQKQEYENLKLLEENQRKELALSLLEGQKKEQELKLTQLESQQAKADIQNYKQEISYKEKINTYYISLIIVFFLALILLIYAYKQREKALAKDRKIYQITLSKAQQQAEIQNLTAMLEGQEKERSRMARDLHDGLGGLLSSTKISLSSLQEKLPDSLQQDLFKTLAQMDLSVEELRRIAHNLMPDLLQRFGLKEALWDYAQRMQTPYLEIDLQFLHYKDSLPIESQLLVYRMVQELVNNAVKHAKASLIIVQFVEEHSNYTLTVEDDGQGFDVDKVKLNSSAGMFNIRSRIDFLKGTLNYQSQIGVGTSIEIIFPKTT
ncbi:histidine kinase [Myroides sp. LJL110]